MVQFPNENSHRTTTTTRHWQQQLNHHLYLEEVSNTNFQHYRGNQKLEMEPTLTAITIYIRNIFLTSFRMDTCAQSKDDPNNWNMQCKQGDGRAAQPETSAADSCIASVPILNVRRLDAPTCIYTLGCLLEL